jgi:hypothetical protein
MRVNTFERFLILAIGGSLIAGFSALMVFTVRDQVTWPREGLLLAAAALFAPVYFLGHRLVEPAPSVGLVITSIVAIIAVASHPIAPRRSTAAIAIAGFLLWGYCTLLVAVAVA